MGLHGPGWLYVLGMPTRADVPLSTPRARATDLDRVPNLRMGSGRAPCIPRSREHEERPAAGREKKCLKGEKNTFICIYFVCIYIICRRFLTGDALSISVTSRETVSRRALEWHKSLHRSMYSPVFTQHIYVDLTTVFPRAAIK